MIATQRPGVYSEYLSSEIYKSNGSEMVCIVAKNLEQNAGVHFEFSKISDIITSFGTEDLMVRLCKIAFINGAKKICCISAGNGTNLEYQTAFDAAKNIENIACLICDSDLEDINNLLVTSTTQASSASKERIAIAACLGSYIETFAQNKNCERLMVLLQKAEDGEDNTARGCFLAAAIAGKIANNDDKTKSLNALVLEGINNLNETYTEAQIDSYLEAGITVCENIASNIEIIRAVSTRTKTNDQTDMTFHDINVVMIIDDVVKDIRQSLKNMISSAKNNAQTRLAIATQASVILEEKKLSEIIYDYNAPIVTINQQDPTACDVTLEFSAAQGLNQILITAYITV